LGRCLNRPKRPHYCTWVERRCPKVYVYRGPWWPSCRATEMRRAAAEEALSGLVYEVTVSQQRPPEC
jgi:hypothetical protein